MNFNIKYLLAFVLFIVFSSCLDNSNQEEIESDVPIDLSLETLEGTWEVYFFTKSILDKTTNIETKYRFTENDGFTVTFSKNGTYYEKNVFGEKTLIEDGIYKLGNFDEVPETVMEGEGPNPNLEKDAIFMKFKSHATKKDTLTKAWIPLMYEKHFAFRDISEGVAQNNGYKIDDIRYFRNIEKAPDYMPPYREFQKNVLRVEDILGRWELYDYTHRINYVKRPTPAEKEAHYGQQYLFRIENGQQMFYEFLPGAVKAERSGRFKITDDVLNLFSEWEVTDPEGNKKDTVEAYKWWPKDEIRIENGQKILRAFDRYRDVNNVLVDIQESESYRWVGNN